MLLAMVNRPFRHPIVQERRKLMRNKGGGNTKIRGYSQRFFCFQLGACINHLCKKYLVKVIVCFYKNLHRPDTCFNSSSGSLCTEIQRDGNLLKWITWRIFALWAFCSHFETFDHSELPLRSVSEFAWSVGNTLLFRNIAPS